LQVQVEAFFRDVQQDEDEYNDAIESLNDGLKSVSLQDPDSIFKCLVQRVIDKPYIKKPFLNLLQRLLILDIDKDKGQKRMVIY